MTTFREDPFIESIWFDYLEIEMIDDGKKAVRNLTAFLCRIEGLSCLSGAFF